MGYDIVIRFKKPFIKCTVPFCKRKHYAKGYCEKHYHKICRGEYRYSLQEYQDMKIAQQLIKTKKSNIRIETEIPIKNKTAKELYQKIKAININEFRYKDIVNITQWKYEKVKKYVLLLVKLNKIIPLGGHSGGNQSTFKISA
jgi:hypothetical protein